MSAKKWLHVVLMGSALTAAGMVQAQATAAADPEACPRTRAEVRAECVAFMKAHRWDEAAGDWVLKVSGKAAAKLPEGVTPREKVRAERDAFLKSNKWNEPAARWEPVGATPREVSKLSRAEVQKETQAFMRTHEWNEATATYMLKGKK